MIPRRLICTLFAVSLTPVPSAAPAATLGAPHDGTGQVNENGLVGPLRIDHSTAVQIQAFAGRADYIGAGVFRPLIPHFASFLALGYGCSRVTSGGIPTLRFSKATGDPVGSGVSCRTVYFVNQKTGMFAGFSTNMPAFDTVAGTRPGMSRVEASRREHKPWVTGPTVWIWKTSANAALVIYASIVVPKHGTWHAGTTVDSLALESARHPIGLEFV